MDALIVSASEKGRTVLAGLLGEAWSIAAVECAQTALLLLETRPFDLLIINTPLADEFGDALARRAAAHSAAGIVLAIRREEAPAWLDAMAAAGVIVLEKPLIPARARSTLAIAAATAGRLESLRRVNQRQRQELEDLRLISRAKFLLIQNLRMTEPQAHHFLEKQAMDRRVSKRLVAEGILRSYEP
jgi:response regulator NasT